MQFNLPKDLSSIIKVIGVGGGGSNAVNHMYKQGIKGVDFIICNTDRQALDLSPVPTKIQLGTTLTEGNGAGSIPEVGKNSAIENIDEVKEILSKNTKMVFITAGMGGGTGTGAAPVIAKAAKDLGILTVGIVTIPFSFEGRRRLQQAQIGLAEMRDAVDTLLVICNDRLREIHGNLKFSESFAKADDILTTAAKGIAEIITVAGYINVDFMDVKTVMENGGTAIMGSATANGENRAIKAATNALSSPLLNDNDIHGAQYILLNVTSGDTELTMDEMAEITDFIQNEAGNTADVIWGNGTDESLGDKISVTVIATGFGNTGESLSKKEPEKVVMDLEDTKPSEPTIINTVEEKEEEKKEDEVDPMEPVLITKEETETKPQFTFEFDDIKKTEEPKDTTENKEVKKFDLYQDDEPELELDKTELDNLKKSSQINAESTSSDDTTSSDISQEEMMKISQERIMKLKSITQKMKNPGGLAELENEPAFKRRNIALDSVPHSSENNVSKYSLSDDGEGSPKLRDDNSFLHDNVD